MAVNKELFHLERFLDKAPGLLKLGGVLAVISFHSLEDRLVKQCMTRLTQACICPRESPLCTCGGQPRARWLTRKGSRPSPQELVDNPRSRSATLRAIKMLQEVGP